MDTMYVKCCIQLLTNSYTINTALVTLVSLYALLVQFTVLVSCHVIENQKIGFTKGLKSGTENG